MFLYAVAAAAHFQIPCMFLHAYAVVHFLLACILYMYRITSSCLFLFPIFIEKRTANYGRILLVTGKAVRALRKIDASEITKAIRELCIASNCCVPEYARECIAKAADREPWPMAKDILDKLLTNINMAKNEGMPVCQDTGMACVFVEIGQEVHIAGALIEDAINEGVRQGYNEGYLRKSVVKDPLNRINTNDNTPAVIYYDITPGDKMRITVVPKGFGSENMSRLKMLKPSDGVKGVKEFVIGAVADAGPDPCPPVVVGVGIGGTFDKVALLAKKALIRPIVERNPCEFYAELENELLEEINSLGIGPQGFGGKTTALAVNIETFPTHIAGLPVAVNIGCHAIRHACKEL